jgi:hypothetical protein
MGFQQYQMSYIGKKSEKKDEIISAIVREENTESNKQIGGLKLDRFNGDFVLKNGSSRF